MIRIEHKTTEQGVFHSRNSEGRLMILNHPKHGEIEKRHSNRNVFPSFAWDDYLVENVGWDEITNYRFAFKSLEQFYSAFEVEEIKEFIELGFEVYYIEATEAIESEFQVVFKPENVTIKQNISELFI